MLYGAVAASELRIILPVLAAASFSGAGGFDVDAFTTNPIQQGSATFSGAGGLTVAGSLLASQFLSANFVGSGLLIANSYITNPSWPTGEALFSGSGTMAANISGQISQSFSQVLDGQSGAQSGNSLRITAPLSAGGSKIRVKFLATSGGAYQVDNASIGIQSTTYNTTDTPVELLFGGNHGFSLSPSQTIISDFVTLSTSTDQVVIVIVDETAVPANYTGYRSAGGPTMYYKAGTDSYNQASPAGSWSTSQSHAVAQIEVYNSI